jgi:hypothetical protein
VTQSGNPGPAITQPGTYYVVAQAQIPSGATAVTGECSVTELAPRTRFFFAGAFALPTGIARTFSFTGMAVVPSGDPPTGPAISCQDTAGNTVTPTSVTWWVSPVG